MIGPWTACTNWKFLFFYAKGWYEYVAKIIHAGTRFPLQIGRKSIYWFKTLFAGPIQADLLQMSLSIVHLVALCLPAPAVKGRVLWGREKHLVTHEYNCTNEKS